MIRNISLFLFGVLVKIFSRHQVFGLHHIPQQPVIFAPNHASFIDPPLLALSIPRKVNFLARASLWKVPLLKLILKHWCAHPLPLGGNNLSIFKQIVSLLKQGQSVAIFPEGQRSYDGNLQTAQVGISLLAKKAAVAIVPIYIHGTFEIWNRYTKLPKLYKRYRTAVVCGTPILVDEQEEHPVIATKVMASIAQLKEWYMSGTVGDPP